MHSKSGILSQLVIMISILKEFIKNPTMFGLHDKLFVLVYVSSISQLLLWFICHILYLAHEASQQTGLRSTVTLVYTLYNLADTSGISCVHWSMCYNMLSVHVASH